VSATRGETRSDTRKTLDPKVNQMTSSSQIVNVIKETVTGRLNFTHAIRKADSVVTHSDEAGIHIYRKGPAVRTLTLSHIMELSVGSDLAVWWIGDYATAGPLTVLYVVSYRTAGADGYLSDRKEITVELNMLEGSL